MSRSHSRRALPPAMMLATYAHVIEELAGTGKAVGVRRPLRAAAIGDASLASAPGWNLLYPSWRKGFVNVLKRRRSALGFGGA